MTFSSVNLKTSGIKTDVIKQTDIFRVAIIGDPIKDTQTVCVTSLNVFAKLKIAGCYVRNHSNGGMSQLLVTGLHREPSAGWSSAVSQTPQRYSGPSVMEIIRGAVALPAAPRL